jgi:hypothetical protein
MANEQRLRGSGCIVISARFARSKRHGVIAAIVALSVMLLGATVWQFSRLRSASAVAAFREVPEIPVDADRLTTWMPDRWRGPRELDLPSRRGIEATYVRGWSAMNHFAQTQESGSVEAWFVGPAKAGVLAIPRSEAAPVWSLGHQLELRFLSSTGTVASVRDHRSRVVREITSPDGPMIVSTDEQFDIVFTMEEGAWRIRHLRRVGGQENEVVLQNGPGVGITPVPSAATGKFVGVARTIRVVLPFAQGNELDAAMKSLQNTLDQAEKQSQKVIVSLFGGRRNHQPTFWPSDELFMKTVVARFQDHRALAMWDLKDKPEADDSISSPMQVRSWLAHTANFLRSMDSAHPMTIAWGSSDAAADPGLAELVDVVSMYSGGSPDDLAAVVAGASGKPVVVVGSDGSLTMGV